MSFYCSPDTCNNWVLSVVLQYTISRGTDRAGGCSAGSDHVSFILRPWIAGWSCIWSWISNESELPGNRTNSLSAYSQNTCQQEQKSPILRKMHCSYFDINDLDLVASMYKLDRARKQDSLTSCLLGVSGSNREALGI